MRVLALDLAARTGWAVADSGKIVDSGEWLLEGGSAERFDALHHQVKSLLTQHGPRYVIFEQPTPRGTPAARALWGYVAIVELCAYRHGTASIDTPPASLKAWATGSGRADKPMMVAECERRTGKIVGHDEADAVLLALYACERVVVNEDLAS